MQIAQQARGLMVFEASIEPQHQAAYRQWHNTEHMPERVAIPGFLCGRRYRRTDDVGRFLMCYDTTGHDVLVSPAYLAALNAPTPKTRQALAWFRDPARHVYTLHSTAGAAAPAAAPVLVTARFESGGGAAVQTTLIEGLAGPARIAGYRIDATGSQVQTSEALIHGAKAEGAGGLLWLECHDLRLLDDEALRSDLQSRLAHWARDHQVGGLEPALFHSIDFACWPLAAGSNTGGSTS